MFDSNITSFSLGAALNKSYFPSTPIKVIRRTFYLTKIGSGLGIPANYNLFRFLNSFSAQTLTIFLGFEELE